MGRIQAGLRRPVTWVVAAVAVLVVGVGLALTEPWTLFMDERVEEALPVAAGGVAPPTTADPANPSTTPEPGAPTTTSPPAPAGPVTLSTGQLVAKDHPASGTVLAIDVGGGARYVRFEGLATDNGPDLRVYLSTAPVGASNGDVADDAEAIDLGLLKGNLGDQNYEVPADIDLSKYRSVVIWCKRFSSAFGAAPLTVAPA